MSNALFDTAFETFTLLRIKIKYFPDIFSFLRDYGNPAFRHHGRNT